MTEPLQIMIVEDEELIRTGLELVIASEPGMEVAGSAGNGQQALEMLEKVQPDLILMDIRMPVMGGIDCIRQIRARKHKAIILILTTFNEEKYIIEALACGANGYLLKGIEFQQLLQTIRDAAQGQYMLPAEVAAKLVQYIYNKERAQKQLPATLAARHGLTKKEQETAVLLLKRLSNKEIADKLYVSEGTVKNYLTAIYDKLQVKNRHEAIRYLQTQAE